MREIDPLDDLVATIRGDLPVLDFGLTIRFAHRSFGGAFTVNGNGTARDKEARQ